MQSPLSGSDLDRALEEGRIRAKRLLNSFRSPDPTETVKAAKRFQSLQAFSGKSLDELQQNPDQVRLKHALDVIAQEVGFSDWPEMKHAWEGTSGLPPREILENLDDDKIFGSGHVGFFLHNWFRNYEEAKEYHSRMGGFLLPHAHQFLVADADYIKTIGLDPDDPDWVAIGYDWAHPTNDEAWKRLDRKLDAWRLHLQEENKR